MVQCASVKFLLHTGDEMKREKITNGLVILMFAGFIGWAIWELVPEADRPLFEIGDEQRQIILEQQKAMSKPWKPQAAAVGDTQPKKSRDTTVPSVGPSFPTAFATTGASGHVWLNTANMSSSTDGGLSSAYPFMGFETPTLECTDFGFSLPSGATITSISFDVRRAANLPNDVSDSSVIVLGGSGTSGNKQAGIWDNSGFHVITYGGDLWGKTWTPADINSSGFGLSITCGNSVNPFVTASIEYIICTVTYSEEEPPVACAFLGASNSGYRSGTDSYAWDFAATGDLNSFLALDVHIFGSATVTALSFNGDPATLIGARSAAGSTHRVECWGLVAPDSGIHAVSVTLSAVVDSVTTGAQYKNVNQGRPAGSFNSATATNVGSANDAEVTVSSPTDGCIIHAACTTDDTGITAGQTSRNNVSGANGSAVQEDTDSAISPAAPTLMSCTGLGTTSIWVIGAYGVRPVGSTQDFPLAAATGSFTLSGNNANFVSGFGLTAGTGLFSETGSAATLAAGRRVAANPATYVLSGPAINLARTRGISASPTNYTVAAANAVITHGYTMPAAIGSFSLMVQNAGLSRTRSLASSPRIFTLTGLLTNTRRTWIVPSDSVAFALSGATATLRHGYQIAAASTTFTKTANNAGLSRTRAVIADPRSLALMGRNANLKATRQLASATGALSLTGPAADVRRSKKFDMATGAFTLTGLASNYLTTRWIVAQAGEFSQAGSDANLRSGWRNFAEPGEFLTSAGDVTLLAARTIPASMGTFLLSGKSTNLFQNPGLVVDSGSFSLAGNAANFLVTHTFPAVAGEFALTSLNTRFLRSYFISVAKTYTLTGTDADLRSKRILRSEAGEMSLAGGDASLRRDGWIIADTGSFLVEAPAVSLRATRTMTADPSSHTLSLQDAGFAAARWLVGTPAAFSMATVAADLRAARYAQFETGAFALTPHGAALQRAARLVAPRGEFQITVNPTDLLAVVSLRGARCVALGVAFYSPNRRKWRW